MSAIVAKASAQVAKAPTTPLAGTEVSIESVDGSEPVVDPIIIGPGGIDPNAWTDNYFVSGPGGVNPNAGTGSTGIDESTEGTEEPILVPSDNDSKLKDDVTSASNQIA